MQSSYHVPLLMGDGEPSNENHHRSTYHVVKTRTWVSRRYHTKYIKYKLFTMADREECVYMAKLAEQAERYDEMVRLIDCCLFSHVHDALRYSTAKVHIIDAFDMH